MDQITIDDFRVDCLVGVLDFEQQVPQPIHLRVALGLDLGPSGDNDDLAETVDYAGVRDVLTFLAVEGHFRLIETLALAMLRAVLALPAHGEARAVVAQAEVEIRKPTILGGPVPGVRLSRDAAWARASTVATEIGGARVEVLHEVERHGSWRVILPPGTTWRAPANTPGLVIAGAVVGHLDRIPADTGAPWRAGPDGAVVIAVSRP